MSSKEAPRPGLLRAARDGKITNREGATALGISVRQFRRLRRRFEQGGNAALVHRSRGRPSPRRIPEAIRRRVSRLIQGRYAGFNDCHLTEILEEHEGVSLARESVRRLRMELGLGAKRRRRPPRHRRRRERQARPGSLVLVDASDHRWCEDRGERFALVGAVDDATGQILGLVARPNEDLHGYALLLRHVLRTHGVPLVLYGDRTGIFVRNDRHWSLEEELAGKRIPTQGGRMLQDLSIGYIPAQSPQAKGRIERFWGTLQDRLVSMLRLRRASSLEETNAYLPEFIEDFNRRFARAPRDPACAWRKAPRDFEDHLACRYARTVAKDNTVTLAGRWIQIPSDHQRRSYAGCSVQIAEQLDGRLLVRFQDQTIARQAAPEEPFTLRSHKGKRHHPPMRPPIKAAPTKSPTTTAAAEPQRPQRPGAKHPWRRYNHFSSAPQAD